MNWLLRPDNGAIWEDVGRVLTLMVEEVRSDVATLLAAKIGPVLGKPYKFRKQVKFRVKKRLKFVEEVTDHVLE